MTGFHHFIAALAQTDVPGDAFNLYAQGNEANAIRRENLRLYLEQMATFGPRLLLVGEAPGYQGCRLTGIPFTSEHIMLGGVDGLDLFGAARGYRKTNEVERIKKEPSATVVWGAIPAIRPLPLLWAAYPFHPHRPGHPWSNRAPRAEELRLGERFLTDILSLFSIETVVAVGNSAAKSLTRLGIEHVKVRHPSQGGKQDFVAGLQKIAAARGRP